MATVSGKQGKMSCLYLSKAFFVYRTYGESLVFGCFHDFPFPRTFVVDAAKMEYAMDDDAVQLLIVVLA